MRRTKPTLIGDILNEFFQRPYVARKIAEGHIPDYWREIVGVRIAELTLDLRLENGILYVRMASGVVRQEIFYRRDMLMQQLNQRAGHQIVNAIIVK